MTSTFPVPLAPSNLARHPVFWSAAEVKAWVEFCVQEFSLSPIAFDRFDMNGKALMLLNRSDFMERAPRVGDVLYNAFTHLSMNSVPGSNYTFNTSLKTPVFISRDLGSQKEYLNSSTNGVPNSSPFVPILPHPSTPTKRHHHTGDGGPVGGEGLESVPVSILSPAATDQSFSDTESCHNYVDSPVKSPGEGEGHNDGMEAASGVGEYKGDCRLLWEFIYQLLSENQNEDLVCWENVDSLIFRINDPNGLADQWGSQKNRTNMTYEKLSRALRYYYKMNIIQKVPGKKLTYRFLQPPGKIRKGQRGAKPHSARSPHRSSLGSCSDNTINNNDTVTMATKEDPVSTKTTLTSRAKRNPSVEDASNVSPTSASAKVPRNSPVTKMNEGEEEKKKIVYKHNTKQETKPNCPNEKSCLENQKADVTNTSDLQAMKYEHYEQRPLQNDSVIEHDNDIGNHEQIREMKLPPLSPPVLGIMDQNRSQSALMLRYSENDDNPEMDIGMEETDFLLRQSDLNESFYDKEPVSPRTTYFENGSLKSRETEVKENINRNSSQSSTRNDMFTVRCNGTNTDINSSIPQNTTTSCTSPLSMSSYFQDDDTSVSCLQEIGKHSQSHPCASHQVQLKCSNPFFQMSENQSPSLEQQDSSTFSRCNDQFSTSPTFLNIPLSPSILNQSSKNSNTTLLVSQAFECLNKNLASPSPSVNQYHDLHPRELQQQQHYHDLSVSQRHHHIKPAHSRHHHHYDYNHIDSLLHSKPLNLATGSTIDNKYSADNNNNNNNIPIENPLSFRQYRNHFNDVGQPRQENIHAPNSHNNKKCCDHSDSSTFLNDPCVTSPSPSLSSPSFDMKMYRHERTPAEEVSKSSLLNGFENELSVGSCRGDVEVNRPVDCSDLPEDLSVKNKCSSL